MATKSDKPASKKMKKTTAKAPAAKVATKPAGDGDVGDMHEKVQLWKDGPYWATTNIGAEKPEDFGYYFWWGDTVGYKRENDKWVATDGSSSDFSFEKRNTPTIVKGKYLENREWIKYLNNRGWITENKVLVPEHDAAHVQWGGEWRMPTEKELQSLVSKCDWTWKNVNGVNGYVVRGKGAYASASIFLPASGCAFSKISKVESYGVGSDGAYWSSVPSRNCANCSWNLGWNDDNFFSGKRYGVGDFIPRDNGCAVRPVQDPGSSVKPVKTSKDKGAVAKPAKKSAAGKHTYTLTLKGEEVEIFRREYKTQTELAECLHCARNWDHAGGDGVYGFVVNRSGVHLEVTDMKRKTVFKKDIKEEDLVAKGGELQIETKGNYFDESAEGTKGKKYYYDCINWYRYEYKAKLELNAPFDPSKLSLTCRTYIGPNGKERKFIQFSTNHPGGEGLRYGGSNLTPVDETPGGDDEMQVWTLVNGVRKEQDIYPDEDEGEGW